MVTLNPFRPSNNLVVKIGSALLVDPKTTKLRTDWLHSLCEDIQFLKRQGLSVTLVSSGAIAIGKTRLNQWGKKLSLSEKQACAAAGQAVLTQAYEDALSPHGIVTAQVLLTLNDTESRRRWLNARGTIGALLNLGVVPIINENDTVATDEIRYGDNDRLAARTAQMIGADTLILLSDINGLYNKDPRTHKDAQHIPVIQALSQEILAMGGEANSVSGMGSGGMATKLAAAQIATTAGCHMCIMNGFGDHPIQRLQDGEIVSWFMADNNPVDARRQWISGHLNMKGRIIIDDGAVKALQKGGSLLAVGISEVSGDFEKGDMVSIQSLKGDQIAAGLVSYNARDTKNILGKNSSEIGIILGYDYGLPVVHRDNLVMS